MSDSQITLYQDSDYRGTSRTLGIGSYASNFGLSSDSLSSIRIPSGLRVILCEHGNFQGRRCILVRDTPSLGEVNDTVSSIIVEPIGEPKVIVYSESDFRGWSAEVPVGSQAVIGAGGDIVSSVLIPSGLKVSLCEHENLQGRRCILVRDTPRLGDANDKASSILVEPIGEPKVIVYSDSDFRGWSAEVPVGSQAVIGAGTDLVSSVLIPSGLKVSLCEHENLQGRRCILVRDTPSLGGANDKASSILVEPLGEPRVIVYSDSNFRGWSAEVPVGRQAAIGAGGDLVSSVIVPSGHRVTLYEDTDFRGGTRELTSDAASLGSFSDRASSIIVDRPTGRVPTLNELKQIIQNVGPRIYFHSDEAFVPSSVEWFLQRASLYSSSGNPRRADSEPLPSGGGDDGAYWLVGSPESRSGELGSAVAYVNAKLQNNWLDIQFWIFYPYNGAGRAYVRVFGTNSLSETVDLAPMGQHGGDWEHATCRVHPDTFELRALYLAQHSGGEWVAMGDIPRENGRPVVYSSLNGHASYRGEGTNLSDGDSRSIEGVKLWEVGLLNETEKSSKVLDCSSKYRILRADFLSSGITAPQWIEYCRRWGPRITYSTNELKDGISDQLSGIPYSSDIVDAIWNKIPDEAKEENGPTGPWRKGSWSGGE